MIYIHILIYVIIIIYLYKYILGRYKGYSGIVQFILEKTEPLIYSHVNHINKPYKKMYIFNSIIKIILMLIVFTISSAYRYIFVPDGYKYLEINNQGWGSVVLLFLLIGMVGLFIYPIHSKKYHARRFLGENKDGYYIDNYEVAHVAQDLSNLFKISFYVILVFYPIFIVSLNQYSYFNEHEIITRDVFDFHDQTIKYEDIDKVERYFKSGPFTDKISTMHYVIYYNEDSKINILFPTYVEQTLEVHRLLKQKSPELFETYTITTEEETFIESHSDKMINQIYEIFGN